MKQLFSLAFFMLIYSSAFSQKIENDSISRLIVHKPPVYPGCEIILGKELKKLCFTEKLNKHIRNNFQYPQIAIDSGFQGRVIVKFEINEKGIVKNISAKGPYPFFEKEAIRIISRLPKMKPAKQKNGNAVKIPFEVPIIFRLE